MIHLLVGSYVQKTDSVFFSLIGHETILMIRCLQISCRISTTFPELAKKRNGAGEASFC